MISRERGGASPTRCESPARTPLARISDAVLEVEAEHGLLALRVEGAPFWQRIRFEVHRRLLVESGAMDAPEGTGAAIRRRFRGRARTLRASVRRSAFSGTPSCDVLFVGGGRRVWDTELGWYSPYCGLIAHACSPRTLVVEHFLGRWSPAAPGVPTRYLDRLYLSALPRRVLSRLPPLPPDVEATLTAVRDALHERTGVRLDLVGTVRSDLAARAHDLPHHRRLLRRTRARLVVVECAYDKHSVVEAARSLGIPVAELQHGVVSRQHFGYHFPEEGGRPPIAPDWLLTWGAYWRRAADFALPDDRVLAVGFPRFDRDRSAASSAPAAGIARPDTILFLSQAMLGTRLSRFASELADNGLRERIVFRLHPRDEDGWERRYPWLAEAGVQVCGSEIPLYAQLASARNHVGTFSTALFEGLGLGGRPFLVPAPGIEYMDELVRSGHATVACTPGELATMLSGGHSVAPASHGSDEDFFRPRALDRACGVVAALAAGELPTDGSPPVSG